MNEALQEFLRRFEPFKGRFDLEPASYQIRNDDMSPGPWISRVHIWEHRPSESVVKPVYPNVDQRYDSKAEADSVALWTGLKWLEDGCPPLKKIGS